MSGLQQGCRVLCDLAPRRDTAVRLAPDGEASGGQFGAASAMRVVALRPLRPLAHNAQDLGQ
jgi:hypothetical protein